MKATINGILLEGTPEEIIQYQKLVEKNETESQHDKFNFDMQKVIKDIQDITGKKPIIIGDAKYYK